MLSVDLAHDDAPVPGELWSSWHPDPLVLAALLMLGGVYWRGRSRSTAAGTRRDGCFAAGLVAVGLAVLSPLDALSGALASAHMVQHLLLTLVAAPLLALSTPAGPLLRGAPAAVRQAIPPVRRRFRPFDAVTSALRRPAVVWLLHVGALWLWHAAALYGAALERPVVHAIEHTVFLVTGVLFWRVVLGSRAVRVSPGLGVLLVFTMTMQSALLALLLTFAQTPWYAGYTTTTRPWRLEQLADQHLAGAIMWVPAGFVYLGTALALLVGWIRSTADDADRRTNSVVPDLPVRVPERT
jgi:putative membrane protein